MLVLLFFFFIPIRLSRSAQSFPRRACLNVFAFAPTVPASPIILGIFFLLSSMSFLASLHRLSLTPPPICDFLPFAPLNPVGTF